MKKSIWMAFVLILTLSLCACGKSSQHDTYREIYQRYHKMSSFYASAKVTVRGVGTETTYAIRQFYEAPDKFALFVDAPEEVAGSGYTTQDGKFLLKSGFGQSAEVDVSFPKEKNTLFLCDFFEEYYSSEEAHAAVNSAPLEQNTVLNCFLTNGKKDRFMQKLTIDNKTFLPLTLETYDIDNRPRVTVEFTDFKRDCDIDQRIFN